MIEYILNSGTYLVVLYGFYLLMLQKAKQPVFNRYFLLFILLFSLVFPLFKIQINLNLGSFSQKFNTNEIINEENVLIGSQFKYHTLKVAVKILYVLISFVLLCRFSLNIFRLMNQVKSGKRVKKQGFVYVLVPQEILPHSFFRYIFLNRNNYENGKIERELVLHEQAHSRQFHSIDILFFELAKIVLWINPIVWLLASSVKENHEYLADENVLKHCDLVLYQQLLVMNVFRNNRINVASNFSYSLTKKRLIMMDKNFSKTRFLGTMMALPFFMFLGLMVVNAQVPTKPTTTTAKQLETSAVQAPAKEKQVKEATTVTEKKKPVKAEGQIPPPPPVRKKVTNEDKSANATTATKSTGNAKESATTPTKVKKTKKGTGTKSSATTTTEKGKQSAEKSTAPKVLKEGTNPKSATATDKSTQGKKETTRAK